jgi:hypothetical protein
MRKQQKERDPNLFHFLCGPACIAILAPVLRRILTTEALYALHAPEQSSPDPDVFPHRRFVHRFSRVFLSHDPGHQEEKSTHDAVVILNLLFGFTLIGWILALVLASKQPQQVTLVYNAPPPLR